MNPSAAMTTPVTSVNPISLARWQAPKLTMEVNGEVSIALLNLLWKTHAVEFFPDAQQPQLTRDTPCGLPSSLWQCHDWPLPFPTSLGRGRPWPFWRITGSRLLPGLWNDRPAPLGRRRKKTHYIGKYMCLKNRCPWHEGCISLQWFFLSNTIPRHCVLCFGISLVISFSQWHVIFWSTAILSKMFKRNHLEHQGTMLDWNLRCWMRPIYENCVAVFWCFWMLFVYNESRQTARTRLQFTISCNAIPSILCQVKD